MHHLIFPSKDSYISNLSPYDNKNFGIDEILRIGSYSQYSRVRVYTHTYTYPTWQYFDCLLIDDFTGTITGSFSGSAQETSGSIVGSGTFTSSYFLGTVTGSVIGYETGSLVSNTQYTGSLIAFSGSISASTSQLDGYITGSLIASYFVTYTGYISGSSGKITGYLSGSNTANEQEYVVKENKIIDRSLLKFDLDVISQSVSDGTIKNPQFKLKLKVAKEEELPLSYKIHGFPVSQSWEPGIGYLSDGGSNSGTSWNWRNFYSGSSWYPITSSDFTPTADYLNDSAAATQSFERGGGTWYYVDNLGNSVACSQSFDYETSDINMDVTSIVRSWLSGSLPNEGFIIMNSTENTSGSNGILTFFSRDTNTIYSPVLDVAWDDTIWVTQSAETSSVTISTAIGGISASIQSGSSVIIAGGVAGIFSASVFLQTNSHYITSSNVSASGEFQQLTANLVGNVSSYTASMDGSISGSSLFTSSYWSGSVDGGVDYESANMGVSGSVIGIISGSFISGSVSYFSGSISSSLATITAVVNGHYLDTASVYIGGIVVGTGTSGNIIGMPIVGNIGGTMLISPGIVIGPCGSSFTSSFVSASFTSGLFSGSSFGSYYVDNKLKNAYLTGSWTQEALYATDVSIPIPSGIEPYAYAYVTGLYVNGKALGTYQITGSISGSTGTNSASFNGQFISGNLTGGIIGVQLSGSVYTSSYQYTSSVTFSSSSIDSIDSRLPFSAIIQNLHPKYTAGNVVRINVFGREEYPLKNFVRKTQMTQYLTPKYLPSSSYYSIKDNETEEIIIDFDNYTRLSCDLSGNFFMLDTTAFAQERNYKLLLKVDDSGSVYVFDNDSVFKIVR